MTTQKLPVNIPHVSWWDGQQVTRTEMRDEQNRNLLIDAANIANFFGSGVVEWSAVPNLIFDSNSLNTDQQTLFDGYSFDGQNIYVGSVNEVSDKVNGVMLEVTLSDVQLTGAATTKVCIIGDEFGGGLIHDDLVFNENGTQVTRGRYKSIRAILFNDFAGNLYGSKRYALDDAYGWIGECTIKETKAMEVSRDPVMASQTAQPNQFFADFHPAGSSDTVYSMLEDAIGPNKAVSDMNIGLESYAKREIEANDVTTRIGQKFMATGTNIQKISVLLSVQDAGYPDGYDWEGSIVLTLHALQTDVSCPVTPVPDTAADFDPDPSIIAQLSLDKAAMELQGVVLGGIPQVVDFVFTGNKIADPIRSPIEVNKYYAFTISRSGNAILGTIQIEEAPHRAVTGYMTIFDGTQWINVKESDMWYSVEGDYVKVADGIAYQDGVGVEVPRIAPDDTNTEMPYMLRYLPFYTSTRDAYNYVLLEEEDLFSDPEQDQRTGNSVYSRVTPSPAVSLISESSLETLLISEPAPVLLGDARDQNPRGNPATIGGTTMLPGLTSGNTFDILLPDADILENNLVRSILYPDSDDSNKYYRITSATYIQDAYGDVNGDGLIDTSDLAIVSDWLVRWIGHVPLSLSDGYVQQLVVDGYLDVLEFLRADVNGDGFVDSSDQALINDYINKYIVSFPVGSTFTREHLTVESILDPLTTSVDIPSENAHFQVVPFVDISWEISYFATWIPDLLLIEDLRRQMPTTFTIPVSDEHPKGSNDFYVPENLLIEDLILNPDGTPYSIDFEFAQLSLEVPLTDSYGNLVFADGYVGILLFDTFVAESMSGKTAKGFDALKYSYGTYVQTADFVGGKVRISVAIQSLVSEHKVPYFGTIDEILGLYYDPSTSLMTLYVDYTLDGRTTLDILKSLSTKILISVYLKKAGFANPDQFISESTMRNLLGL